MFSDSKPLSNISPAVPAANLPVFGSGTVGRLTKWGGFTSTNSAIGDSGIYEDKFGKVGIGTDSPTSKLTVAGVVESSGGLKFPDGTVQVTDWPYAEPDRARARSRQPRKTSCSRQSELHDKPDY